MIGPSLTVAPQVSVVIPCFNAEDTLREAVSSVLAQTDPSWVIFAVDDGSSDSTGEVIRDLSREIGPRLVGLFSMNKGACHARNLALRASGTEYVAFLDADDCWRPDKLAVQLAFLRQNPETVAVTCSYTLFDKGEQKRSRLLRFGWSKSEVRNWTLIGRLAPAMNSTMVARRQAVIDAGLFNESLVSFAEDLDLAWRLLALGEIKSAPQELASIQLSPRQIHRDRSAMAEGLQKFYGFLSETAPRLAKRGEASLEFYRLAWQFAENPTAQLFFRVALFALSHPIVVTTFFLRQIPGFRASVLRVGDPA